MRCTIKNLHPGYEGETIEQKTNRVVNNKEPITNGAPKIYKSRASGVQTAYNIRTDRFEIAVEAMDKVQKQHIAKRMARIEENKKKQDGGAESTQGTSIEPK